MKSTLYYRSIFIKSGTAKQGMFPTITFITVQYTTLNFTEWVTGILLVARILTDALVQK
jgi:hypothetical protein